MTLLGRMTARQIEKMVLNKPALNRTFRPCGAASSSQTATCTAWSWLSVLWFYCGCASQMAMTGFRRLLPVILCGLMLCCSCATRTAQRTSAEWLAIGRLAEDRGQLEQALAAYRSARSANHATTAETAAARADCVRLLVRLNRTEEAMDMLQPLPTAPRNLNDCHQLLMAADVLQIMGHAQEAENLLKTAADSKVSWQQAPRLGADLLARAALAFQHDRDLHKARSTMEKARELYRQTGQAEQERRCREWLRRLPEK